METDFMTFQIFKRLTFVSLIVVSSQLIVGCQLLPNDTVHNSVESATAHPDNQDVVDYFLWLNSLNNQELQKEHQRLNAKISNKATDTHLTKVRLMLTHSIPHSPLYKPQKAITQFQLFESMLTSEQNRTFLAALVKHLNTTVSLQQASEASTKTKQQLQRKLDAQAKQLINLKRQNQTLQNQIDQLKQIESSINTNAHINRP